LFGAADMDIVTSARVLLVQNEVHVLFHCQDICVLS